MNTAINNSAYYPDPNNQFNFKKIYSIVILKWYWILISLVVFLIGAWFYVNNVSPQYNIRSSIIINEYESGIKRLSLSQNQSNDRYVNIMEQDHTGRLRSHFMGITTLQSLGWNTTWYEKKLLYGDDLYLNEPYIVTLLPNKSNVTGIPIFVKALNAKEYRIEVDAKDKMNRSIKISQTGRLGEPFESQYLNFTLDQANPNIDTKGSIYFTINNLSKMALEYQGKLKVITDEKKPDMMELIYSDNNAKRGVDYINKLEQTYIEYGLNEKNRVAENTINFIDNQLRSVTDSLSYSEKKVTSFRTITQSIDLNQTGGMVMERKENLESEKAILESRLAYLTDLYNNIHESKSLKHVAIPSVFGITDQTLNTLVAKLSDLYTRREVLSFTVKEKAPSLILLDNEIKLTNSMVASNLNTLLATTKMELNNLNKRAGGFSNQLTILPKTEQELNSLQRNFELNNDLYTYLLKMRAESAITYASNQPDVRVLDPARIETTTQSKPMPLLNYIIAILLGISLPIFIIVLAYTLNNRIQTEDEVQELTQIPISGTITHNKNKNELVIVKNPRSAIAESFRSLRTNLKYLLNGNDNNIIAIQSIISGEGKSFISVNLATILAMNDLKVLIIGADMRKPKLNDIFGSSNKKGLSTYLSDQNQFDEIIESTLIENLDFISSGPIPPNPTELLENKKFEKLLQEAKSRYKYIILDCPPISLVSDGTIIGRQADLNLLSVRFRYSSSDQFKLINELGKNKIFPLLTLVLNDAKSINFKYGNSYDRRNKHYYHESGE